VQASRSLWFHLTVILTAGACCRKPLQKLSVYVASKTKASVFHCIVLNEKVSCWAAAVHTSYNIMPAIQCSQWQFKKVEKHLWKQIYVLSRSVEVNKF